MKTKYLTRLMNLIFSITLSLFIAACSEESDSSGSSSSPPASIIDYKLVMTVESSEILSGSPNVMDSGETLTYQFIDPDTIYGEGRNEVGTSSWNYSLEGSTGYVTLNYSVGTENIELNFDSETTGSFIYTAEFYNSGSSARYTGSFYITYFGTDGEDGGDSNSACLNNNTGDMTFYVSDPNAVGSVSLYVDNVGSDSTSYYWTSGQPDCGSYESGAMTFTSVPAGTYSFNASDQDGKTWQGSNASINACDCLLYELQ